MVSETVLIALGVTALIFCWHVFLMMQLAPDMRGFLSENNRQPRQHSPFGSNTVLEPSRNTQKRREETVVGKPSSAAQRHQEAANLILDDLNENIDRYSDHRQYRMAYLAKEHFDIAHAEYEGTGTDTEEYLEETISDLSGLLEKLDTNIQQI